VCPDKNISFFVFSNFFFKIAPKINAAGRISHGKASVELMISDNLKQAHQIVDEIMSLNDERRELDMTSTHQALEQIKTSGQEHNCRLPSRMEQRSHWNRCFQTDGKLLQTDIGIHRRQQWRDGSVCKISFRFQCP